MRIAGWTLIALLAAPAGAADIAVIEEIVAKVNGDIITRSEIERSLKILESEIRRALPPAEAEKELAEREKHILRDKIDQLLLIQKGKELNINVDPQVSKYLADLQLQSKIAEPEKFQAWVREQTGQPFEDYKAEIKNSFLTQRVIQQEVGGRIQVPRAELEKYYNEHKNEFIREERIFLREILVSTEGKDEKGIAAAEKKARELAARARKGEKFGELARDHSDAVTARNYGELPPAKKGDLNPKIEQLVWSQERGYVTDPIRVDTGFLILKVEDKHRAGLAPFEEVENEIMEKLFMPRFQPAVREYLTKLRYEAFLEIKPGYVDSAAAPGKNTAWTDPAQLKPETVTKEEVAQRPRRKRLLWAVPIPGTKSAPKSSSK